MYVHVPGNERLGIAYMPAVRLIDQRFPPSNHHCRSISLGTRSWHPRRVHGTPAAAKIVHVGPERRMQAGCQWERNTAPRLYRQTCMEQEPLSQIRRNIFLSCAVP